MRNKIYYIKIAQKFYAYQLLLSFVFISFAQAFHHHENHSHFTCGKNYHTKQNLSEHIAKTCQICEFTLNKNQAKNLPTTQYFNFKQVNNIEMLHPKKCVAFHTSKHLSLYSGTSPPTV